VKKHILEHDGSGDSSQTGKPMTSVKERLLFFCLTLLCAMPVWLVAYFPSQDGPIHLWILHLLRHYWEAEHAVLHAFFEPNLRLEPNLGFYLLSYPLSLAFDPKIAERVFLTFITFVFCYGARYSLTFLRKDGVYLSYLAIPVVYHHFVHMGFYNYALGVAAFLPILVFCLHAYQSGGAGAFFKLMLGCLLLVSIHLIAFVMLAVALATYATVLEISKYRRGLSWRFLIDLSKGRLLWLGIALIPATLVFLSFTAEHGVTENVRPDPLRMIFQLLSGRVLYSFDNIEHYSRGLPVIGLLGFVLALVARRVSGKLREDPRVLGLLAVLVAFMALYFFASVSSANVWVHPRLALFIFLVLILFFSGFDLPVRMRHLVMGVCVIVVFADVAVRTLQYRDFNAEIEAFVAASEHIDEGSTLLPLDIVRHRDDERRFSALTGDRADFMRHVGGYLAMERQAVYLRSPLMSPTFFSYFPFRFRREMDPSALLGEKDQEGRLLDIPGGLESRNPGVDFDAFAAATGRRVDYLVISGPSSSAMARPGHTPKEVRVRDELDLRYTLIWASDNGRHQLYALHD
jgi:hypothetical protein